MLVEGIYIGYTSQLVLFELFGALSEINVEVAYEAINACLNLPLKSLKLNRETFTYTKEIALYSNVTYDSIHAALIA